MEILTSDTVKQNFKLMRQKWFNLISAERDRQDEKWGFPQTNTFAEWAAILAEETGECCKELNELNFQDGNKETMIEEAIQTAAVAMAIIEHFDIAKKITLQLRKAR